MEGIDGRNLLVMGVERYILSRSSYGVEINEKGESGRSEV